MSPFPQPQPTVRFSSSEDDKLIRQPTGHTRRYITGRLAGGGLLLLRHLSRGCGYSRGVTAVTSFYIMPSWKDPFPGFSRDYL